MIRKDENELVPDRVKSEWHVRIDYRKLNASTRKDHFSFPFKDQILEKLARHSYHYFLDGYSGYTQISIALEDWDKTTFTCPLGTFAFRRMSFGFCNAPATFQHCIIYIIFDMIEQYIDVLVDAFYVFGSSFDDCLANLTRVLQRCREKNLILN